VGDEPRQRKKELHSKLQLWRTHKWKTENGQDYGLEYVGEFDGIPTQYMMAYL
jgi:hypothetical protein